MFIQINNHKESNELKKLNIITKKIFGTIPPHLKLLGQIDSDKLKDFLIYIKKVINHDKIHPDYFGFLRLFIANKENFRYCIQFNTKLLQNRNYSLEIINNVKSDLSKLPLDNKHKLLAIKSIKAIFDSKNFNSNDFKELLKVGWSHKDIFDSIDHAGFILKNGKILTAYSI